MREAFFLKRYAKIFKRYADFLKRYANRYLKRYATEVSYAQEVVENFLRICNLLSQFGIVIVKRQFEIGKVF